MALNYNDTIEEFKRIIEEETDTKSLLEGLLGVSYGVGNRKVKCKFCQVTDAKQSEMILEVRNTAKSTYKDYYHEACYPAHLEDKMFKEKEAQERDELNETLKEIFKRPQMGGYIWTLINAVRNGDEIGLINGRYKAQRYKEGVSYSKLNEAFKYSADDIDWALYNKNFTNPANEFKYCLQIAVGNLIHVETQDENYERVSKHLKLMNTPEDDEEENFESSYDYEVDKDENDISFLFD